MEDYWTLMKFWDYLEYYLDEDESGFDGVHHGGIKGIRDDAPVSAKKAYEEWREEQERLLKQGIKV